MKELSIEEKAQRYDEALEKAKQIVETPYTAHWDVMKDVVYRLFPQLEDRDGEMIKFIIQALQTAGLEFSELRKIQSWLDEKRT